MRIRQRKQDSSTNDDIMTKINPVFEHAAAADDDDEKEKEKKKQRKSSTWFFLLSACIWCGNVMMVWTILHWLPSPVPSSSSMMNEPNGGHHQTQHFSEERTRGHLSNLLAFGARTVGSEANERHVPAFLVETIERFAAKRRPGYVEWDVQHPSGAFGLNFLASFQNIYANITNILVKVYPEDIRDVDKATIPTLLISGHYDSAIGSVGASDDGVSIAIMLELLELLMAHPPTEMAILFNFNGAEESILQASHGFITQHRWKDSIVAFINLEAAGAGGKELLFQSGHDVLTRAYAQGAPHPHSSCVGEELFQSGIIPSDTDFRIYRDYGDLPGLDFAFISNGYVYHTALDTLDKINSGSIQHCGANVYATIRELVHSPDVATRLKTSSSSSTTDDHPMDHINQEEKSKGTIVHFDYLGLVLIWLPFSWLTVGLLIGMAIVLLEFITREPLPPPPAFGGSETISSWTQGLFTSFSTLCRMNGAGLGLTLASSILTSAWCPMIWYHYPILTVPLYVLPVVSGWLLFYHTQQHPQLEQQHVFDAQMFSWVLWTLTGLGFGLRSSYLPGSFMIFLFLGCQCRQRCQSSCSYSDSRSVAVCFFIIERMCWSIPLCHALQLTFTALDFFLPLMGRSGTTLPSDVIVASLCYVFCLLNFSTFGHSALVMVSSSSSSKKRLLLSWLGLVYLITMLMARCLNPYSELRPKRIFLQHITRSLQLDHSTDFRNDSGMWIHSMDYQGNEPLESMFKSFIRKTTSIEEEELDDSISYDLYSNFPYFLPLRKVLPARNAWYLPMPSPFRQQHSSSRRRNGVEEEDLEAPVRLSSVLLKHPNPESSGNRRLALTISGPSHITVVIEASVLNPILKWSLGQHHHDATPVREQDVYFLHFTSGSSSASASEFHFWIETLTSAPLRIGVAGHYLHWRHRTKELNDTLALLPSYVSPVSFVSHFVVQQV